MQSQYDNTTDLEYVRNLIFAQSQLLLSHALRLDPSRIYLPFPSPPGENIVLLEFLLLTVNHRL